MASSAPARSRSGTRTSASRKAPARRAPAKRPASRSRSRRPSQRRQSATTQLFHGISATLTTIWGLLAKTVGGLTRGLTGGAKDLDPAHRRDGLGLLLLAGALIAAGGVWWHAGAAGDAVAGLL